MSASVSYDAELVAEIAARFDLRKPNQEALDTLVRYISESEEYVELVTDLATGVGKTYLMVALVEYLAYQGVRNILIVTPGKTIQNKTLANFDRTSPKYVSGAEFSPTLVTPDNFQISSVAKNIHNLRSLKIYVFNVQQLLAPRENSSEENPARRVRRPSEEFGGIIYDHLQQLEDLFVITDEHHVYNKGATAFSRAVRDIQPNALIGLTATPDESDSDKVVYEYTLGRAIADGYVKTPVIVYRKDGTNDDEVHLLDACRLLERKQEAYRAYQQNHCKQAVNPVLFVVCKEIEHAQQMHEVLIGEQYLGSRDKVLLIHSQSDDKALEQLASVEDPESPVRAIVSVNMLKEGWDVKNIAVIVALRALASQGLTAQILGRGLRLPYGQRTGNEQVDQVDLVTHESYRQLLAQKRVLKEQINSSSVRQKVDTSGALNESEIPKNVRETIQHGDMLGGGLTGGDYEDSEIASVKIGAHPPTGSGHSDDEPEFAMRDLDMRSNEPQAVYHRRRTGSPKIGFPSRRAKIEHRSFDLAEIESRAAREAGADVAGELPSKLFRDKVVSTRDGDELGLAPARSTEAAQRKVPLPEVVKTLLARIMILDPVEKTRPQQRAAKTLIDDFIDGAGGGETWGSRRLDMAVDVLNNLVLTAAKDAAPQTRYDVNRVEIPGEPEHYRETDLRQATDEYVKRQPFVGWNTSIMPAQTFDAKTTEWELAHLIDRDDDVLWWQRIYQPGPAYIQTDRGRYYPDFIAIDKENTHWIIETKADVDAQDADVLFKRAEARKLARSADAHGLGKWRHLFATESDIGNAGGSWKSLLVTSETDR